jgi:poly(ADP-ribose) glycohydrolase
MDAIFFRDRNKQFEMESVHRELDKAYTSFRPIGPDREFAIVTGNWGCGAFNGDRHLKGLKYCDRIKVSV